MKTALLVLIFAAIGISRDGKFANHLRDSPCLCEAGRFRAGQDASSCRRDDSGARTQSKSLPCDEGTDLAHCLGETSIH